MEAKYSVELCCLIFMWYATNPYVVSILLKNDASVHRILFKMSTRSFPMSLSMEIFLCFLSLLLKRWLFLWEVLFPCCVHLICDPTVIFFWIYPFALFVFSWGAVQAPCFDVFALTFLYCCCFFFLGLTTLLLLMLVFHFVNRVFKAMDLLTMILYILNKILDMASISSSF